jgi:CheY-like chemotaxis protein
MTEPPTHARRVLIVDDYPDTVESLAIVLQLAGFEVEVAHDGPTALALLPRFQPTAIVLDIGLPGMDGWEVARSIRASEYAGDTLIVAVSGHATQRHIDGSLAAGCDKHLIKPVNPDELVQLLNGSARPAVARR